ncbi:hypothetical protein BXZ70DRAFT_1004344 [Cristinia sonorae]|uniref:Uncharacterized protein n=1 Tax=Cristinia sonorae TaxID=1940300 RepID=A0A8K0XTQ0_9AGAR|nr:hypothetical protein BXZ70DRAFT_1004344 [Cristinia sonorae]
MSANSQHPTQGTDPDGVESNDFVSNILAPGSSLHPTFQLLLDLAFAMLLCVFIALAILTKGNPHIFVLIAIEGCLWASVKWVVRELQKVPPNASEPEDITKEKRD